MANFLTFTTPDGENLSFTITAQANGSAVLYSDTFNTAGGGIFLKVYETGDATKTSLDPANLVEGTMYDVEAFSDAGFTPGNEVDITTWGGTNITYVGYTVAVDRRPMYVGGYATGTQGGSEITFGRNTVAYRKTPLTAAPDADFTDPLKNGRIDWIDNNAANAITEGIERVNYSNPAGWTSVADVNATFPTLQGNFQPHYPSNWYTGMTLTQATLFAGEDTNVGAITWDTPFTVGGYSNSDTINKGATDTTPGDQKKAWAAAVQHTKDLINAQVPTGTPEVICYGGYRPLWTDKNQTAFDKTLLGYSKVSTEAGTDYQWSGLGSSPGWTPEPGWDGVGGTANSSDTFNDWFAEELAGAYSLGFTAVGLDTGANVWKHAGGMSNSGTNSEYTNAYNFSDGNGRIIDVFNSYGLKPMFESVALDRWTHMPVNSYDKTKLVPMTGNDGEYYKQAATWAQAFTWWGYVRDVETDGTPKASIDFSEFNNTLSGWQASGGSVFYVNGVATIGDPLLAGAGAFSTTESEVHAVFRWGSSEVNAVLQQTDGWILLKQMMYDFHSAGLIVSAAANTSDPFHGVTAAEFLQFVVELHENLSLTRPAVVAGWETTEIGVGEFSEISASERAVTYDVAYPAEATFDHANIKFNGTNENKYPASGFMANSSVLQLCEYVAVWTPNHNLGTGFNQNQISGWFVYQANADRSGTGLDYDNPIAWPTIPASASSNNRTGLICTVNPGTGGDCFMIQMEALPAGLVAGEGGTDSWSPPPA